MGYFQRFNTTTAENTFRPLLDLINFANLDLLSVPLKSCQLTLSKAIIQQSWEKWMTSFLEATSVFILTVFF
jgi:hypothetical protein